MRALVQRVTRGSVAVEQPDGAQQVTGAIGRGLVVLVGATHDDRVEQAHWLADKIAGLRVFDDADGVPNLDVTEVDGDVLVVSQFTLYASTRKGRRPSYVDAARPEVAEPLVEALVDRLRGHGLAVPTGRFGAMMQVELVNDGPLTFVLESP